MPLKIHRFLLSFFTLTTLLATPEVYALVLGEIRSSSRLGEFLHAEIEVEEDASDRFEASCVKLYRPAQANKDLPWITEGRLSFRRENGKGKLFISSDRPLLDPVVQIGIQSSCAGVRIWRDYVLLASPHVVPSRDFPVVQPVPAILSKPIERISAATRSPRETRSEAGTADVAKKNTKPATTEPMLRLSTVEIAAPTHTSTRAIGVVDVVLPLRMSTELRSSVASTDFERELLRLEYRILTELHNQAESQLALSEKLRRLENSAGELKVAREYLGAGVDSATQIPAVSIAPTQTVEKPESKVVLEKASLESADDSTDVLLYVVLGTSLLFFLLLIMRRQRTSQMAELLEPTHAPTIIVEYPEFSRPPPRQIDAVQLGDDVAANALPLVSAAVVEPIPPPPESLEATPVMELAEIMLSFGRVNGAAQTLQEFIEANPKAALQPWMRLLEIYRDSGMRADFEALATNLNQNFNVEVVHWDAAAPGERIEMSLELLPHIRDQIDALWGKSECLEYLQQLLRENRDGQRTGFTLPVVKEILLLIDLMVAEKAATK